MGLRKVTEEQAQKLAENTVYINKLQNQEKFLAQNVMYFWINSFCLPLYVSQFCHKSLTRERLLY